MKTVERILIKLAIIHVILLITVQFVFHQLNLLPEIHKLVFYEGVEKMEYSEIVETLSR
ncbi:YpfB family protein [Rossellomorea sp. SC111]|uniref:YpfB family protein n=1 Tax=Rossellomorea sp. SC111 TaxID=2968985 RepID=UPI00215A6EFC|nr:YpfB family protein [Rossellomorea sp. SC111]MCR8846963.1 YpfB family protein [Rossellomorea sp. SC111]